MPLHSVLATITHENNSYFAVLVNHSGLSESIGWSQIVAASAAYLAGAFVLAVAAVRLSPRGWLGRLFRRYLWLIPLSPLVIVCGALGLLFRKVAAGPGFPAMSVRWLFEKATGHQTYQRQRRYSKHYYKDSGRGGDV